MHRKAVFVTSVVAHRGASARFPENSEVAFRGARELGADGVELDVRRTADRALAVCHDPTLPDGRHVVDTAAADLPDGVCLLGAALDACEGLALVNVEIKNWPDDPDFDDDMAIVGPTVDALLARGDDELRRWVVSSFHLPTVDRVREVEPRLATGWLLIDASDTVAVVERAVAHGHGAIHPHHLFVGPELVARAHDAGLAVNTWTVDEPDRIRWLADIGVDAVITNVPDIAVAALK